METHIPCTLQDCFDIINASLPAAVKQAVMQACEFELQYAFPANLEQWVKTHIVERYNLRGEDFFLATDLWHQALLLNDPHTLSTLILLEYRKHLLACPGIRRDLCS